MTKDDTIKLAREAGLQPYYDEQEPAIERFYNLVATAEREACAKLCESADKSTHPADLANVIRTRGTT